MRVRVHRNLHKKCWSVVDPKTGRVLWHLDKVAIKDATFVVRPGGRARVLREQKKNVHAFIVGDLVPNARAKNWDQVRYNPYDAPNFMYERNGHRRAILNAPCVKLDATGRAWAARP